MEKLRRLCAPFRLKYLGALFGLDILCRAGKICVRYLALHHWASEVLAQGIT